MENTLPADTPLITSAPELAAAYGLPWPADSCHCCGARILDGRCCSWDNPEITRPVQCVCPTGQPPADKPPITGGPDLMAELKASLARAREAREQGPLAVQQPGRGAS